MAATDLSGAGAYRINRITLSSTADAAREVILPAWAEWIDVRFYTSGGGTDGGRIALTGTDETAIGTDVWPLEDGEVYTGCVYSGRGEGHTSTASGPSRYLAGTTSGGYAHIVVYGYWTQRG